MTEFGLETSSEPDARVRTPDCARDGALVFLPMFASAPLF
jgi:hypothetical protein